MSKRTLADELRSVLLAHSMDAPDPDDTVERILAGTVKHASRAEAEPPVAARRRRLPPARLLVAATVVGLVALGGVGAAKLLRDGHGSSASTADSANRTAPAAGAASTPGGPLLQRPNVAQAPGFAANPPAPSDLGCSSIPNGQVTVGAHTTFTLSVTGETLSVYEYLCIGSNGRRTASEVQVFGVRGGRLSYLSTLVPVAKDGHLNYLTAIPDGVTIQGTDNSPGARPGDLVSVSYTTHDGGRSFSASGKIVAKACQREDLTAQVATVDGGVTGQHQVLRLTNHTLYPCALEGFPQLTVTLNGRPMGSVSPSLSGPAGGVTRAKLPPIVNLIPGGTAAAIIEFTTIHPGCAPGNAVTVTLPTGVSLGSVPAALSPCGLFVHPLVDNPDGLN